MWRAAMTRRTPHLRRAADRPALPLSTHFSRALGPARPTSPTLPRLRAARGATTRPTALRRRVRCSSPDAELKKLRIVAVMHIVHDQHGCAMITRHLQKGRIDDVERIVFARVNSTSVSVIVHQWGTLAARPRSAAAASLKTVGWTKICLARLRRGAAHATLDQTAARRGRAFR